MDADFAALKAALNVYNTALKEKEHTTFEELYHHGNKCANLLKTIKTNIAALNNQLKTAESVYKKIELRHQVYSREVHEAQQLEARIQETTRKRTYFESIRDQYMAECKKANEDILNSEAELMRLVINFNNGDLSPNDYKAGYDSCMREITKYYDNPSNFIFDVQRNHCVHSYVDIHNIAEIPPIDLYRCETFNKHVCDYNSKKRFEVYFCKECHPVKCTICNKCQYSTECRQCGGDASGFGAGRRRYTPLSFLLPTK